MLDKISSNSTDETFININEEIIENVYIILTSGKDMLKGTKDWDGIVRTIEFYSERTEDIGISKKIQFKCLDIIDELDE